MTKGISEAFTIEYYIAKKVVSPIICCRLARATLNYSPILIV